MITNIEEFKEVIEGSYGIKDLKSYEEYKMKVGARGVNKAEIELLSPDNVNSCSFWEYIAKNPEIAKDAVSYGITKEKSIDDVNRQNYGLACSLGVLNNIMLYKDEVGMPILDIGAGYGMLKEFVKQYTKLTYVGVDVYPKIEAVQQVASDGSTLPPNIMASKFGLVVACNVFQHLSLKQRRHYYKQIESILYPNFGVFTVTLATNALHLNRRPFQCSEDGKGYLCHYGQYTPVQTIEEIEDDLLKHFRIISVCQRTIDDVFTFHCYRKEPTSPIYVFPAVNEKA